jgi:hypothetical protein
MKNNTLRTATALAFVLFICCSFNTTGLKNDFSKEGIIKIFPDPKDNGTVYVSLLNEKNQDLQFYMFDLDGKLIDNFHLKTKTINKIDRLHKGIYMYDVFKNDESIERGSVEIK